MPMEAILGFVGDLGRPTDVWSLGAVLYEVLTGLPFSSPASKEEAFVDAVLVDRRLKFRKDVPESLQGICRRRLAFDQRERFRTAGELATNLRAFLEGNKVPRSDSEESRLAS